MNEQLKKIEAEFNKQFTGIYESPHVFERFRGWNDKTSTNNVKSFLLKTASEMYEKGVVDTRMEAGIERYNQAKEDGTLDKHFPVLDTPLGCPHGRGVGQMCPHCLGVDVPKVREEAHETEHGYCCACEYDIAGFESKLTQRTAEIRSMIMGMDLDKPEVINSPNYTQGRQEFQAECLNAIRKLNK